MEEDLTWRGVVSRFIRIWKRDTLDEERPLKAAKDEKAEYAIKRYMRLDGKDASVEAQIKQAKAAEDIIRSHQIISISGLLRIKLNTKITKNELMR